MREISLRIFVSGDSDGEEETKEARAEQQEREQGKEMSGIKKKTMIAWNEAHVTISNAESV